MEATNKTAERKTSLRREPSSPHHFQIRAESIVMLHEFGKAEFTFVIFKPEEETLERLKSLKPRAVIGAIALIDKWDDGEQDVLESIAAHKFVSFDLAGSHGMKTSSWILTTDIHRG